MKKGPIHTRFLDMDKPERRYSCSALIAGAPACCSRCHHDPDEEGTGEFRATLMSGTKLEVCCVVHCWLIENNLTADAAAHA